jgi:nucleoside-diphosphate-sugar epimerase
MIVAITGGTGFIGAALAARHLAAGDEVRVLTRRPPQAANGIRYFAGDLADAGFDARQFVEGADVLYHCAGELRDAARMHALHVEGTGRLLATAAGRIGRWVQLSSVGAYGPRRDGLVDEATPERPVGPYETTKTQADALVLAAARTGGFAACLLRPSNVIGPAMPSQYFMSMISAIARGLFVFIGPPGAVANYIHVDNVAAALMLCARPQGMPSQVYILSDHCSFEELVDLVCAELRRPAPRLRMPRWSAEALAHSVGRLPGFPLTPARVNALTTRVVYQARKIVDEGGYRPVFSLAQSIRQMAAAWNHAA